MTLNALPLNPVTPLQSSRYDAVKESQNSGSRQKKLPSGPLHQKRGDLDQYMYDLGGLPPEWEQHVHVDGKPYFRHKSWRVLTEVYLRYATLRAKIEALYQQVESARLAKKPDMKMSDSIELYLTLDPKPAYYYVDNELQSIFWLDDLSLDALGLSNKAPAMSLELFIERNYYRHLENFPAHSKLPQGAEDYLRGALTHACTEHMTSRESSTAPWNAADCKTFIELLDGIKDDVSTYKTWYVARLLVNILNSRFLHRYGMYEARTDRLASLELPRPRQALAPLEDLITGVLFFCAPYTYVDRLEKVWADRVVSLEGWQKLLTSLLIEWSDSNLLATVTLSANMALLALNDLNSLSRTASIASSLFAIGSIVIGLHHVWRHRVKVDTDASQATAYLQNATRTVPSLKFLAFFLSLPLVLLSWSLIVFAFAVSAYAFYEPDSRTWWTYAIIGAVLAAVSGVVVSSMAFFWGIFAERNDVWWTNIVKPKRKVNTGSSSNP